MLTYLDIINGTLDYELYVNEGPKIYENTTYRARKKKLDINISEDDFYNIISEPCYLCGKWNMVDHYGSI